MQLMLPGAHNASPYSPDVLHGKQFNVRMGAIVQGKKFAISAAQTFTSPGFSMMSRRILLLAAFGLVALVATVAIARTMGVQTTSASRNVNGEGMETLSGQNPSPWHSNLSCGT
ncbi:MAG TPA: hypothetical protein VIY48_05720, partial [Candidatus Paceibacterota bacterium]